MITTKMITTKMITTKNTKEYEGHEAFFDQISS